MIKIEALREKVAGRYVQVVIQDSVDYCVFFTTCLKILIVLQKSLQYRHPPHTPHP